MIKQPFLVLCSRRHLPNWCYFGDIFNGRILLPPLPTSESALIPWLIPPPSSLLFPPLCPYETNKEECRTKSLQAALKGMPSFLLYFCFYFSPLSIPPCHTYRQLHARTWTVTLTRRSTHTHTYIGTQTQFCFCLRRLISSGLCV